MKFKILILCLFIFKIFSFGSEFSIEEAEKVDRFLKKAREKQKRSVFLKQITFTQDELNSYLNIIYTKKYAPEVKYIKLNLENGNYVNGTMKVKLTGQKYEKVPSFLKNIEVEFNGKVECENYRMRFFFEDLKINGASFSPEILDEAFSAAQTNFKVKKSMFDWFDLLPGLKNSVIGYKKITLYY